MTRWDLRDDDETDAPAVDPAESSPGRWEVLVFRARSRWVGAGRRVRVAVVASGVAAAAAAFTVVARGGPAGTGSERQGSRPVWALRLEQWVRTSPVDSTTSWNTVDRVACLDVDPDDPPDRAAQIYLTALLPGSRPRSILRVIDQAGGLCGGQASVTTDDGSAVALVRVMAADDTQAAPFTRTTSDDAVALPAEDDLAAAYVWCTAGNGRIVVAARYGGSQPSARSLVQACTRTARLWR